MVIYTIKPIQSMISAIIRGIVSVCLITSTFTLSAQPKNDSPRSSPIITKPYKVLTNGRKITVQATSSINKLMVWTANGHRILEQSKINTLSYSFEVPSKDKILFVLIELVNGQRFTEKVGVK